ncbi:zinc ribbon domain-containing protein [Bacillus sp. V3B]|uniref:zinc ribbon domain-containing protein n=1 Tax=Bacillus sp. V3B TaxID=2804915 RepID=UPI00210A54DD|nr:zinc ribbon domain-containing protein [Bacillus sp. V3B]MCQ6277095.1 zinc ribbon domain-containing protein [Bacillus sp. V3B]
MRKVKNCQSCGAALSQDARFCTSCGAPVNREEPIGEQQISAGAEAEIRPKQPEIRTPGKFPFWKKPIFIVLILLIVGGSATAAFLLKLSPKELYLLSEYKTFQQSVTELETKYGDTIEFQEKALEQPSQSEVVLSGDLELDSAAGDPEFEMMRELLSAASISAKTVQDPVNKQGHYSLALNVENKKAIDVELFQSKDQMGIKVPLLYEKFFYLNFNEYGEFMRMIDPYYVGPETLELSDLELKNFIVTDKEKEYLQEQYSEFLLTELKDESFQVQKGVKYEHEGEQMKLRAVRLTLSAIETKELVNRFMDHIIQDQELHNMIVNRVEKLAEAAALEGELAAELSDASELKEEMVDGLKEMKNEMQAIDYPNGFTSTLLIDKNEQIIDRHMTLALSVDGEQINTVVTSKNVPYGDNQKLNEWKVELSPEEDEDFNAIFQFTNHIQTKKETRTEDLKATFSVEEYGNKEDVTFTMASHFKGADGSKQTINREFELGFNGRSFYDAPNEIKGEIKQVSDVNLKKEYSDEKFTIELEMEDDYDSGSITLNLDTKTTLKDKVQLPTLDTNSDDGLNVVKISEDEMFAISEKVGTNIYELGEKYGLIPEDSYYRYEDSYYDYGYDDYYYEDSYYDYGEDYYFDGY